MVAILVFANWGKPAHIEIATVSGAVVVGTRVAMNAAGTSVKTFDGEKVRVSAAEIATIGYGVGLYAGIYRGRFWIAGVFCLLLLAQLAAWFQREELKDWSVPTWGFAKQIMPLLFAGVLVAGFLLGRPGQEALIPNAWIASLVGGNSLGANLLAALSGALMYFAMLTHPAGPPRLGDGEGARLGPASRGTRLVAAGDARAAQHHGNAKDAGVRLAGGRPVHARRGCRRALVVRTGMGIIAVAFHYEGNYASIDSSLVNMKEKG